MSKFMERFKARHQTSGKPQSYEDCYNPHNSDLDGDGKKDLSDIPADDTKKESAKGSYKN